MSTYFFYLFIFRYLRLVVNLVSFWLFYRPTPVPSRPSLRPSDCTVILPTVDPTNPCFEECLLSCLINQPGVVIVVTTGAELTQITRPIVSPYKQRFPYTKISVKTTSVANKRLQIAHGLEYVNTKITVLLDDNVFWPSARFLPTLLAPFEDPQVGIVGTNKRVRRTEKGFNMNSFWNMLGALYFERHNFELRATNAIDGGVSVISSETSAHRSRILTDPEFVSAFTNEQVRFGLLGPIESDPDHFITRWNVNHGHKLKIQYSTDSCIETTLATSPSFLSQCLNAARTTWRINAAALFSDGAVWYRQPWSLYAVYLTFFVNFALVYDGVLIYTLMESKLNKDPTALPYLIRWILFTKIIKLTPYFLREPQDLLMLPGYLLFAYFHSLIKLYAALTFWNTSSATESLSLTSRVQAQAQAQTQTQARPAQPVPRDNRVNALQQPEPPVVTPRPRPRGRPRTTLTPSIETDNLVVTRAGTQSLDSPPMKKKGRGRPRKNA
ncbi:hypothetical protein BDW59DRAFT_170455 [Aspergillus cavernicola]|uniref:Nucleotide-diphospho-sugar transferase n=1 Tax=Aspergillus cavernicola TaxID=176166 RepID=A0ABR4INR7_9EURO